VTTAKIDNSAVTTEKIADGAVTWDKLSNHVQGRITDLEEHVEDLDGGIAMAMALGGMQTAPGKRFNFTLGVAVPIVTSRP
jgi:hypothetical protein